MRVYASLILLSILCTSASAFAQGATASLYLECERAVKEACWALKFGRCASENPRIAIWACTRQMFEPSNVWNSSPGSSFRRLDQAQRYSLRASAHAKLGDIVQALDDYDRAIRTHGGLYWIHTLRGSALFSLGAEQEALASYDEAIRLEPNSALIFNARARLLSTARDENVRNGPQAIADAQRATELEPGQPNFVAGLAIVYAESGEFENAVVTQQRAIDLLEPNDQGAIDHYRSRLDLYRQGMAAERQFISCETIKDSPDPDYENGSSFLLPYIVFCFADGA